MKVQSYVHKYVYAFILWMQISKATPQNLHMKSFQMKSTWWRQDKQHPYNHVSLKEKLSV